MNKTMVVNAFAGPGAGKTTSAWYIAAELKKRGYVVEYVSEYAKDLVWDEKYVLLDGSMEHQTAIYDEQKHRIDRLLGKVDIVVTDSTIILTPMYLNKEVTTKKERKEFVNMVLQDWNTYQSFSYFVERNDEHYEQQGRLQDLEGAKKLDKDIKTFLKDNNIYFGVYKHSTMDLTLSNIMQNFKNDKALNKHKTKLKL